MARSRSEKHSVGELAVKLQLDAAMHFVETARTATGLRQKSKEMAG